MKKFYATLTLLILLVGSSFSQYVNRVEASSYDFSENLDLQAIASIYGDAYNLEDFERRLNNPYNRISNLDLNYDGQVDYLRVVSSSDRFVHIIVIQAVIGRNRFQDVATIEVEKDRHGHQFVQVIGNEYMYGYDYIIEPVYISRPALSLFLFGNLYRPWRSPYFWGYYPHYYRAWHPCSVHRYRDYVHNHINVHHHYNHVQQRRSHGASHLHRDLSRSDYSRSHPNRSFSKRNTGVRNQRELSNNRVSQSRDSRNSRNSSSVRNSSNTRQGSSRVNNSRTGNSRNESTRSNSNRNSSNRNNSSSVSNRNDNRSGSSKNSSNRGTSTRQSSNKKSQSGSSVRNTGSRSSSSKAVNQRGSSSPKRSSVNNGRSQSSNKKSSNTSTRSSNKKRSNATASRSNGSSSSKRSSSNSRR